MTQIVDARKAIIEILKADADTTTEVQGRVFGDELPRSETDAMPRKAVVISPAGGTPLSYTTGTLPLETQRLDVFCYGGTLYEAEEVRRAVYGALRAVERQVIAGVLVHWARPAGGAMSGRDPDADWPLKWNSWQILADERAAA
ncbi:hypothetical protein LCGC14_1258270 [marine sediment metagenome]|uniref:Uncharacterized protein n=1 Tax=marine sediment metagenome TaxID=412755 RepID=A0A0F9L3W9_9ZZZZ